MNYVEYYIDDKKYNMNITLGQAEKLYYISQTIKERLKNTNLTKISFSDVGSHPDILIQGLHKEIPNYYYGDYIKIKADFSNVDKAIEEFVNMWIKKDTPEGVESYKRFLDWGNTYGWD